MSHHSLNIASGEEIERLLFHMPSVASQFDDPWAKSFAESVIKHSRRKNWKPSPKQLPIMRRLVSDLFAYGREEEEFNPIES